MDEKDQIIAELRQLVAELQTQVRQQNERIAELELQLAKAQKDSSTSSKAPSSDIVKPPKRTRIAAKRPNRGGQKGHQRNLREPLPPERVDKAIVYEIDADEVDQRQLTPTDEFELIQHIELLDLPIYVTEHRLRKYRDGNGKHGAARGAGTQRPTPVRPATVGPDGWLKSRGHASYTTIETFMNDVLQIPVSRGYLSKLCTGAISASLARCASTKSRRRVPATRRAG